MHNRWSGQRVVVTGGAGFLGSHVVEELHARGAKEVLVPRSAQTDLTDQSATMEYVARVKPTVIIHLAARVGGIGANAKSPGTFFYHNMAMGLSVLEAAHRYSVPKVVIAGTVCAYPKFTPSPFKEDALWDGYPEETNAPYGVAKKALLVMAQSYRQEFGSNFVMLFPTNLYGPRDNFDLQSSHVIPAMIRKIETARLQGQEQVVLWGDGSPTREFLHVRDAARAFADAAERYDGAEPINVGSGEEVSMLALGEQIAQLLGYSGKLVWDATKPNGQPKRRLDVSRARERLGFSANVRLQDGLAETIAWYRASQSA